MSSRKEFTLGLLSAPHLGDTICTSSLPRKFYETHGYRPKVISHPTTISVFKNNPYISGFTNNITSRLDRRLKGNGHIIQRLERGMGLDVSDIPRSEIYLSNEEKAWALSQKKSWPSNKPYCYLALRSVTDGHCFADVDWQPWLAMLERHFTIIQPIVSNAKEYRKHSGANYSHWPAEPIAENAIVYEDLDIRQYFSLFSAVDCYCGVLTSGSHLAAAFNLPSLVFVWDELYKDLEFPINAGHLSPQTFLYSQQIQVNAHSYPDDNKTELEEFLVPYYDFETLNYQ